MIKTNAYAKLDLAIDISPKKLADGYFPVHYIDTQIDLCDRLFFDKQKREIELICDNPAVPKGEDNFVIKAASALKKIAGQKNLGAKITLFKNIPIKAGFGGGSSDAASTLHGLSKLWSISLNEEQLISIAKVLGKDFYYSLYGGLAEVQGEGKNYKVTPLSSCLPKFWLLILVPFDQKPSTSWVYEHLRPKSVGQNFGKIEKLKAAILKKDKCAVLKNLTNDFENYVPSYYPVILKMKDDLARVGAQATLMAGSGLSVVGFFDSKRKVEEGKKKLLRTKGIKQVFVSTTKN